MCPRNSHAIAIFPPDRPSGGCSKMAPNIPRMTRGLLARELPEVSAVTALTSGPDVGRRHVASRIDASQQALRALTSARREPLLVEVVVHPEVCDRLLSHHPAQRVPELGLLDEQVVLGIEAGRDL